jgi:orotate phosphoribosyltransferase
MKEELIRILRQYYRKGNFTLSSGKSSEHYINCKPVILTGSSLELISYAMLEHIDTDVVAGLTLGADPLVSGVAMVKKGTALIIRKEPKGYGTASQIEGPLPELGTEITVLEDVITTGGSSIKAVNVLRSSGYIVNRVVSVIDREEGGEEKLKDNGLQLRSLVKLSEMV